MTARMAEAILRSRGMLSTPRGEHDRYGDS